MKKLRCNSINGFYHVRDIGINHFAVFNDYKDRQKFKSLLQSYIEESGVQIVAYCILNNHFHLLVQGEKEFISLYMKNVKARYAQWYNFKYQRSGALFDGRFRSDPIKDRGHFFEVLRYIHLNPVKAGCAKTVDEYEFSSYNCYVGKIDNLVNSHIIFDEMNEAEFIALHCKIPDMHKYDMFPKRNCLVDEQASEIIREVVGTGKEKSFDKMDFHMLMLTLAELKRRGLAIRQISRLTGIPKSIVEKAR